MENLACALFAASGAAIMRVKCPALQTLFSEDFKAAAAASQMALKLTLLHKCEPAAMLYWTFRTGGSQMTHKGLCVFF